MEADQYLQLQRLRLKHTIRMPCYIGRLLRVSLVCFNGWRSGHVRRLVLSGSEKCGCKSFVLMYSNKREQIWHASLFCKVVSVSR